MATLPRLILAAIAMLTLLRTIAYALYASQAIAFPVESFHLEAKMVHLAWRVRAGEVWYPNWRAYPHVANFFAPGYFWVVGSIGRLLGVGIDGLFPIGRTVTAGCGLITVSIVGFSVWRRDGPMAGVVAGALCASAVPLIGFSVMVRPDLMAETLGIVGWFVHAGRWRGRGLTGGALFVLAILTKQTALVFPVAAALALLLERRFRETVVLVVGCALAVSAVVTALTLTSEPYCFASFFGEASAPIDIAYWQMIVLRLLVRGPDLVFFPIVGILCWTFRAPRDARSALLAGVLLASSFLTTAKYGSELNYFLSLRVVEALALGRLWHAFRSEDPKTRRMATASGLVGMALLVPGVHSMSSQARGALRQRTFWTSPIGQDELDARRRLYEVAGNSETRLLTDCGIVALYQRGRAPFVDPFLFRTLVEVGSIRPARMFAWLQTGHYDYVLTTADLFSPHYDSYRFGLPAPLAEAARRRYVLIGIEAGVFFYGKAEDKNRRP